MTFATMILAAALSQQPAPRPVAPIPPVVGRWILKSATIADKPVPKEQAAGMFKELGGLELGMRWDLSACQPAGRGAHEGISETNGTRGEWVFHAGSRELCVGISESWHFFAARVEAFDLELTMWDEDKPTVLIFSPER